MTLSETIAALTELRDSDAPTTRKATVALLAELNKSIEPLREWTRDLDAALEEVELAAETLEEGDTDDREDNHAELSSVVDQVLDLLSTAAPAAA